MIIELKQMEVELENVKLKRNYDQFQGLLSELRKRELAQNIVDFINKKIEDINITTFVNKELRKLIKQKETTIIKFLEKEAKIVPKEYYQNFWLGAGMCVFGVPIGVFLELIIKKDTGLIAIGIPIGMAIGILLGSRMDKKAFKEGRQLDIKIKY